MRNYEIMFLLRPNLTEEERRRTSMRFDRLSPTTAARSFSRTNGAVAPSLTRSLVLKRGTTATTSSSLPIGSDGAGKEDPG